MKRTITCNRHILDALTHPLATEDLIAEAEAMLKTSKAVFDDDELLVCRRGARRIVELTRALWDEFAATHDLVR